MTDQHKLQLLYRHAVLIANCDQRPDALLVCFSPRNTREMERAMADFEAHHHHAPEKGIFSSGYPCIGFWLPKTLHAPHVSKPYHTIESKYLERLGFAGELPYVREARTAEDLNPQLHAALARGLVAQQSWHYN